MVETPSNDKAGTSQVDSIVPDWLQAELFEDLLKDTVPGYKKVVNFKPYGALAPGENYATIMLRVNIEVEVEDGILKTVSYMCKVPHKNEKFQEWVKLHNIFAIETDTYREVVPEFEQMYREAGAEVKFAAHCYKLNTEEYYVLLEDLSTRGFKNKNRLTGLDMDHSKWVLRKLAQWHAASATRVETKGPYGEEYLIGLFNEGTKGLIKELNDSVALTLKKCLPSYKDHETYATEVEQLQSIITEEFFKLGKVDRNDFNVLNHGDCWSNNIMFQYDDSGKITETFFVDLQIPKYGSPAQDLLYFILSSTKLELKLNHFEYLIKFYHDHLTESLTLLKYPSKMPTLKDIHMQLYKYGLWGYYTVTGVMSFVLVDPQENASFDTIMDESEVGSDFKTLMYSNERYRKHAEVLLPWLQNRGALSTDNNN